MAVFQLLYTVFLIAQRPLEEPKSNLIEVINELFLSVLMTGMLYFNSKSRWTYTASQSTIWMFWGINIAIFLITAIDTIKEIIKTIKSRRRSVIVANAISNENSQRNILNQNEERIYSENYNIENLPREQEEVKIEANKTIYFNSPTTMISQLASSKIASPSNAEEMVIPYDEIE